MVLRQVSSNCQQLLPLGHIYACRDSHLGRTHIKIKSTPRGLLQSLACPPRRDMRLVRSLVLRKSNITIDPHHHLLRGPYMIRRKLQHRLIHLCDQRQHWSLQLLFIHRLALIKPDTVVMPLQPTQEFQRRFRKMRSHLSIVNAGPPYDVVAGFQSFSCILASKGQVHLWNP
jgi:hypothetical protein